MSIIYDQNQDRYIDTDYEDYEFREKLNLDLENCDGNAFALLGYFQKEARKAEWSAEEIKEVMEEAQSGDYDHLLRTLMEQ